MRQQADELERTLFHEWQEGRPIEAKSVPIVSVAISFSTAIALFTPRNLLVFTSSWPAPSSAPSTTLIAFAADSKLSASLGVTIFESERNVLTCEIVEQAEEDSLRFSHHFRVRGWW